MPELQHDITSPSNGVIIPNAELDPILSAIREANHITAIYERHFAGRRRASRDVRLLGELIERLGDIRERLSGFGEPGERERTVDRLAAVEQELVLFNGERGEILSARPSLAPIERAAVLATRIDEQFALYRTHFAGQLRLSRRPRLLHRVIVSLEDIRAELDDPELVALDDDGQSTGNRKLLDDELRRLRRELGMIELEHQASSSAERTAMLGASANADLRAYNLYFAAQDRGTRDLVQLRGICDRLTEIEWQFIDLSREYRSEALARSLDAVQICLDMYGSEYEHIAALQRGGATAADDED
ncbi:hypothetical protein [Haliangium ochraceum]|uniref:Uncharacterized protein n=1 Tax=Haliangium ochraceum (strain DSM 14365 / JCM 11303 / SMP-2) TaxID=502025 RepID=D0LWT1_HALO1|nr:hypothetical protein [Haliangium ochraceum]ACY14178.1 hypothetical protein Hoch_1628 [Haliangium ochraceum DSM 14365]